MPLDARTRLRQSYPMPTHEGMEAYVGWDVEDGTYWFAIVHVRKGFDGKPQPTSFDDVFYAGGDDVDRITNVGDLVRRTWGEIYWQDTKAKTLHLLRDEPMIQAICEADVNETPYPGDCEAWVLKTLDEVVVDPPAIVAPGQSQPPEPGRRSFFSRR